MKNMKLRNLHPNLFFAILIFGVWGIMTGYNFVTGGTALDLGNWRYLFGTLFLIFGSSKLIGLIGPDMVRISRMGMLGCMVLCMLLSTFYFANYLSGDLVGWQGALNFLALGVVQLTAISEPAANPLNMKREKDDR